MRLKLFFADEQLDKYNILGWLQLLIAGGLVFLACYSLQFWQHVAHPGAVLRIFGVAVLSALGFLLVGFLLGFIFCIPRTPAKPAANNTPAAAGAASQENPADAVESNSNLNEISDWLTKIIVGVGLVQLNKIPGKMGELASYLGAGLRNCTGDSSDPCTKNSEALALGIVIFFITVGFLFGYIWTRFYYQRTLSELARRADRTDKSWNIVLYAETLLQQNQLAEANSFIDQALALSPNHPGALMAKGRILKRMAQSPGPALNMDLLKQALKYATQAWEVVPDRAEPGYNVACYQALLGTDKAAVLKVLQKVFSLSPRLKAVARQDADFQTLWQDPDFQQVTS